jgi:hypothetical protein
LTKLLAEHAPGAAVRRRVEDYRGRVVAIDTSLSIYQFLVSFPGRGGVPPSLIYSTPFRFSCEYDCSNRVILFWECLDSGKI